MTTISVSSKKMIEPTMGMWNSLLQLNVLRKANHKEDEEHYNDINEVVHSIFKVAIQSRQLKQEREGNDTTNESYENYKEEILELIQEELTRLQKDNPHILLNMSTDLFERLVKEVLEDKDTMNIAVMQWVNMLEAQEKYKAIANGEVVENGTVGTVVTSGATGAVSGGMPTGGIPSNGIPRQLLPNMGNIYPQNPNQNQEATIVPQDTPEGQETIDEIDKQTGRHFRKKLNSITKNGIHPQVALVATNTGALIAGMLIPGAGFLIMTAALKANLEILPKWPKKKLKPVVQNWFTDPELNKPKEKPEKNEQNNPSNPQQENQQVPPPYNGMPNGIMPGTGMGPGMAQGMVQGGIGIAGGIGGVGVVGANGTTKNLQIWETVASNLVHNNRIKTEVKLTYYVDEKGKVYINSKEYGIKSDKEYIELTPDNLQDYLTIMAKKNGLGETESMKEFIEQVSKIAKGEIGIKEINNGFIGAINASAKLSEMSEGGKLSEYGKEIYNELTLKKLENLVEFDPNQPIEDEIIKQLKETKEILIEKLKPENLEKLKEEEQQQFTQMLNGVNNALNMIEIYKGIELIKEKEQEIDLLKDKKKLNELYIRRDNNNKQEKELNESNNAIQEEKKKLDEQIKNEQEQVNKFQEIVNLQTKRDDLEKQFEKELEDLHSSFGVIGLFEDGEDNGIKEQIENEIKNKTEERDKQLQEIDKQLQEKGINSQEARKSLQQHQEELNKLKQQQTNLETREKENKEKIATITESKDEIDKEIKQYEDRVKTKQTDIEKELEQSKQEKLNKLQNEKKEVKKLKKEKDKIEKGKKELDNLILNKQKEIESISIDKTNTDTEEEVIDLDKKIKESQKQLEELISKKQQKEKESKEKDEELKKYRTVENIDKEIDSIEKSYKKQIDYLGNIDSIEDKQEEVKKMKEEVSQQKQNCMSQDLILIQQQMLQKSQFAGLSKVLKFESVDIPQYQAPVISVGQGKSKDVNIG